MTATIAVVNDDTAFLSLMHDLLTEEGFNTILHKVGETAHEVIKERQPDLIILDVRMETPEEGWKVIELTRLDRATARIPIIVATADSTFIRDRRAQLEKHGCTILEKPFDLDELLATVDRVLGSAAS